MSICEDHARHTRVSNQQVLREKNICSTQQQRMLVAAVVKVWRRLSEKCRCVGKASGCCWRVAWITSRLIFGDPKRHTSPMFHLVREKRYLLIRTTIHAKTLLRSYSTREADQPFTKIGLIALSEIIGDSISRMN